jgi:hypothetical protein
MWKQALPAPPLAASREVFISLIASFARKQKQAFVSLASLANKTGLSFLDSPPSPIFFI